MTINELEARLAEWKDGGWRANNTVFYRRISIALVPGESMLELLKTLLNRGWYLYMDDKGEYLYYGA